VVIRRLLIDLTAWLVGWIFGCLFLASACVGCAARQVIEHRIEVHPHFHSHQLRVPAWPQIEPPGKTPAPDIV
jgi:hypothetical protein